MARAGDAWCFSVSFLGESQYLKGWLEMKMTRRQAERVLKLSKLLRTVPDDGFYMGSFLRNPSGEGIPYILQKTLDDHSSFCGTTACALGWSSVLFPDRIRLRKWLGLMNFDFRLDDDFWSGTTFDGPEVMCFFGLSEAECQSAFGCVHRSASQEADFLETLANVRGWGLSRNGDVAVRIQPQTKISAKHLVLEAYSF